MQQIKVVKIFKEAQEELDALCRRTKCARMGTRNEAIQTFSRCLK